MKSEELEQLAKDIDNTIKKQVEKLKTLEPMKKLTNHKKTFEICEKQLRKNIKDKNILALFNLFKESLINHLIEIRDYDCIKLYSMGLGLSAYAEYEMEKEKESK